MNTKIIKYCLLGFILWSFTSMIAQKEGNIWYFGNETGLDFNFNPPKKLLNGAINSLEGCSSICDSNGNIMFYTDGTTVWNKTHQIMENGDSLSGAESSTQAAIIVPQPETNNYYIFCSSSYYKTLRIVGGKAVYIEPGIYYSIVDMTNGVGKVTIKNRKIANSAKESLTATLHKNRKDIWIISGIPNRKSFHLFLLDKNKLSKKTINLPILKSNNPSCLKFSPNGKLLAYSSGDFSTSIIKNKIYVFDFNNITGQISNTRYIDSVDSYGLEFSSNSTILFFSNRKSNSYSASLHCVKIKNFNNKNIENTNIKNITDEFTLNSTLQIGPNKKIYIQSTSHNSLAVINDPNDYNNCQFKDKAIVFKNGRLHVGLPNNLNYQYPLPSDSLLCSTNQYQLKVVRMAVDSIQWNFNNTEYFTTTTSSIVRNMTTAGEKYWIKVYANGAMYELEDSNKYTPLPIIELGNDTLLCKKETLNINLNTTTETIQWEDGSTAPKRLIKANPDNYKNLKVEVSNKYCTTSDSIKIRFVACGIQSQYLCKGDSTSIVLNESIIDKAEWNLGNGVIKTTLTNTVKHKYFQKGKHTFSVIITHNGLAKTLTDSVFITELENNFLMDNDTFCEEKLIYPSLTDNYTYSWDNGNTEKGILAMPINIGRWYVLTISKNGCSVKDSIFISSANCECNVYIPNSFTPNGDNLNDIFKPITECNISHLQLHIYNRWGEKIYQSGNAKSIHWDGKYKNEACQNGIYIWRVSYITSQGIRKNKSGNVYLMR